VNLNIADVSGDGKFAVTGVPGVMGAAVARSSRRNL
jgi:hypothetical protein